MERWHLRQWARGFAESISESRVAGLTRRRGDAMTGTGATGRYWTVSVMTNALWTGLEPGGTGFSGGAAR
jgi:hypothetical protein